MESMMIPSTKSKDSSVKIRGVVTRYENEYLVAMVLFDIKRMKEDTKVIGAKLYAQNIDSLKRMINNMFRIYGNQEALLIKIPERASEGECWSEKLKE